jgi:hypothetical protein
VATSEQLRLFERAPRQPLGADLDPGPAVVEAGGPALLVVVLRGKRACRPAPARRVPRRVDASEALPAG